MSMEANLENLSLGLEEEVGFEIDVEKGTPTEINNDHSLVGRFLIDRVIRFTAMRGRMCTIWRPVKGVFVKELGQGRYLFQFFHKLDMMRVLNGGPWTFDNHTLVLGTVQAGDILAQIPLNHVNFWVQVHDVPVGFMTELVGQHLGNFVFTFLEYDTHNDDGVWRSYMRLRVNVDVRMPLKREKKIRKPGGEWRIVKFKYKKLGTFCFLCGLLGHTDQFCDKLFMLEKDDGSQKWGVELRADLWQGGGAGNFFRSG